MDALLPNMIRERDRERWLAILWAPAAARAALVAISAIDLEMARVVTEARDAMLAEIRLAWWREQLVALARGAAPPPQPILRALAHDAQPRGVDLALLSSIEDGHLPHLWDGPLDVASTAAGRGGPLFRSMSRAIAGGATADDPGAAADAAAAAGIIWAMAQLVRHHGAAVPADLPDPRPALLARPLRGLVRLAAADLRAAASGRPLPVAATTGRQWTLARAALFG